MKPPREMSLSEIEFLIATHMFPANSEREMAANCVRELIHIIDFIEYRINSYVPLACSCDYCGEIRTRKPRASKAPKEKEPPVHFSLD